MGQMDIRNSANHYDIRGDLFPEIWDKGNKGGGEGIRAGKSDTPGTETALTEEQ